MRDALALGMAEGYPVCPPGAARLSSRFREILSDDLRLFDTREEARLWLAGTGPTVTG